MKNYVLAFMIDTVKNEILLIRKNRPAFQAGKLNGIGGKIEGDEKPIDAIIREVKEETGLESSEYDWLNFGSMELFDGGVVHLFRSFRSDLDNAESITDEQVIVREINYTDLKPLVMPNLIWLIDAALDDSIASINIKLY